MRAGCAIAAALCALATGLVSPPVAALVAAVPPAGTPARPSVHRIVLSFSVSVCLADFEYAIGCRTRSSLEAARRLEQIYLDDYATGVPGGSLRIWFAVKAEPGEQTRFLHEIESRAIESVFRKLQDDVRRRAGSAAAAAGADDEGRAFAQDIRRWYDNASAEARAGSDWAHDWGARAHTLKPGEALRELARLGNRNRQTGD